MNLKISHIQKFSLHDGPGIRTTVFLGGCPLRCRWCHNPETQSAEPLLQGDAILSLRERVSIHMAIETCGYAKEELFRRVIAGMDYVMYDIKLADEAEHLRYTGVSNKPILRNLKLLQESGIPYLIRTPLIPGITDTSENLEAIRTLIGNGPWEQLPYNPLAPVKYAQLGWKYPLGE